MCEQHGILGWIGPFLEFIDHLEAYSGWNFWFIGCVQRPVPLTTAVMANDVQDDPISNCYQPEMLAEHSFSAHCKWYRFRTDH